MGFDAETAVSVTVPHAQCQFRRVFTSVVLDTGVNARSSVRLRTRYLCYVLAVEIQSL